MLRKKEPTALTAMSSLPRSGFLNTFSYPFPVTSVPLFVLPLVKGCQAPMVRASTVPIMTACRRPAIRRLQKTASSRTSTRSTSSKSGTGRQLSTWTGLNRHGKNSRMRSGTALKPFTVTATPAEAAQRIMLQST